jgi:hypothetical protein
MKTLFRFLFFTCVLIFSSAAYAQVTNLLVNGSSTHFTMESGSEISWNYNLPVGDTALLQIWIDVNSNTLIEPATDVLWQSFYQIDGRMDLNGPPDLDGSVNGQIAFAQPVGLAPADYIMSFNNNNSPVTISGTVTPITSPVFTISGSVTVPAGKSAQYLVISLENQSEGNNRFWNAITDAGGNFSVQMDADTSGNPWVLSIDNQYALNPAVLSPDRIALTLDAGVTTTYPGNNFTFTDAAAEINGTVKDEDGNVLIGGDVYMNWNDGSFSRNVQTDAAGTYRIGFLSGELPASNVWLGSGNIEDTSIVSASAQIQNVNAGNVITKHLTIYRTNSTISGIVTLSGNPPNMNIEIYANVSDTGAVRTFTNFDGSYTLHVSNKLYNYSVGAGQLPPNYYGYSITAHPGQTNVNFNFNLTDVEQEQSAIPEEFSLLQNYPNPFNPTTKIRYTIPSVGTSLMKFVQLKVYDVLGNKVATLVDEEKPAGNYEIDFDASKLPSGVYFYKLTAGELISTHKMILIR